MENAVEFAVPDETSEEQSFMFLSESYMNSDVLIETELDEFEVDIEAKNQHCSDLTWDMVVEESRKGLFAPFSHDMRPDLEYMKLESERFASNPEAATKIMRDRYSLMKENAARYKEKKEKHKVMSTQFQNNVNTGDIKETMQSFQNLHITSCLLTKDQSRESSDYDLKLISGQKMFSAPMNSNIERDINANFVSDVTVTEPSECIVQDLNKHMENVFISDEKVMGMDPLSENLGAVSCEKFTRTSGDKFNVETSHADGSWACCSEL